MASKSNKGVKLSLGEFIGTAGGSTATSSLPKGPAQRAPDDDGSFKRPVRRTENYDDQPPSRSEGDGNWRRGGGGGSGAPSTSFVGSSSGDNYNEQAPSRSEGDGNWRRGGGGNSGAPSTSGDNYNEQAASRSEGDGNWRRGGGGNIGGATRDSYVNNRGGSDNDRSSGGYNRDTGNGNSNNWRGGGMDRETANPPSSSAGERPRLQLKSRTIASPAPIVVTNSTTQQSSDQSTDDSKVKPNPFGSATAVDTNTKLSELEITKANPVEITKPTPESNINPENKEETPHDSTKKVVVTEDSVLVVSEIRATKENNADDEKSESKLSPAKTEKKEKAKREPEVINSRAAAFGSNNSESNGERRENQGPPLIMNSRFEKLADEERARKSERESAGRRDRFPENDEGPPLVVNSRFSAAADADRSYNKPDDRGPPPVANSRFSAAAEADRSYVRPDDRGPPPVMNSRFAAVAEADRSSIYQNRESFDGPPPVANSRFAAAAEADGRSSFARDDRGPPPVANSRFAAAAALAEDEKMEYDDRRRERESFYNRDDQNQSRGAIPQNSRFAAAAAADSDYADRGSREQSSARFGDRDGDTYRRGGLGDGSRGSRMMTGVNRNDREFDEPPPPPQMSRVDELLKQKKQDDVHIVPPTKEHEANILKMPEKVFKREEETFLAHPSKKADKTPIIEGNPPAVPVVSADLMNSLIAEFSSGEKLGDELKEWCASMKPLPSLEKLLFDMLKCREKLNPDPNCDWAEPSKYGKAIIYLIEENLHNQMQVLWAIQMYCETLGFPKVDGESVVQSMFRAMYKYDLAEADAFIEWKEDESDAYEKGKMSTVIQTTEWFNWLEADDDDDVDDDDDEIEE